MQSRARRAPESIYSLTQFTTMFLFNYDTNRTPEEQLLDFILAEYKGGDLTPKKATAIECVLQDFLKQFPDTKLTTAFMRPCSGCFLEPCTVKGRQVTTNHFVRGDQVSVSNVEYKFKGYVELHHSLLDVEFHGGVFVPLRLSFTPRNTGITAPDADYNLRFQTHRGVSGLTINIPTNFPRKVEYQSWAN